MAKAYVTLKFVTEQHRSILLIYTKLIVFATDEMNRRVYKVIPMCRYASQATQKHNEI